MLASKLRMSCVRAFDEALNMTIKKNTGFALLLLAFSTNLWAHGDVVPQAVKTEGLDPLGDEWFKERVINGAVRDGRVYMPKMADYLSQEALWAVRSYLESVAIEE